MKTPSLALAATLLAGVSLLPVHAVAAPTAAETAALRADVKDIIADLKADADKLKAEEQSSSGRSGFGAHAQVTGGAPVPEPATWILMGGLGLAVAAFATRERKRVQA